MYECMHAFRISTIYLSYVPDLKKKLRLERRKSQKTFIFAQSDCFQRMYITIYL